MVVGVGRESVRGQRRDGYGMWGENTCSGKNIKFNLKKSFCAKQIIPLTIFLTSVKCTFVNYTLPGTIK